MIHGTSIVKDCESRYKDQTSFTTRRRPLTGSQTALTPTMDLKPKEDTNSKPAPNSNDVRLVAQN